MSETLNPQPPEITSDRDDRRTTRRRRRNQRIESSATYRVVRSLARAMDRYGLDPVLGMIPGVGDSVALFCLLPFLYISIFKVRSLPLSLAVTANALGDVFLGLIPFWVGDVIDFFYCSNLRNLRLIVGYVERDPATVRRVHKYAAWMAVIIVLLCVAIYFMFILAARFFAWIFG